MGKTVTRAAKGANGLSTRSGSPIMIDHTRLDAGDAALQRPHEQHPVFGRSQPDRETLRREYCDEGMTASALAKRYGVPRRTVVKWLEALAIPTRQRGRPQKKRSEIAERLVDTDGYVIVWRPGHPNARRNGYILESRWVMSELLGRTLLPTELVLHRDGNKQNNDPRNLYIAHAGSSAQSTKGAPMALTPMHTPEVDSAEKAVRAAIVAEHRGK